MIEEHCRYGSCSCSSRFFDESKFISRDKRIEIYKDGNLLDIALIDAVISKDVFIGSKAIWNMDAIENICNKRSPASIGFSSLVGCKKIIYPHDDFGAYVDLNSSRSENIKAPIAAGLVESISVSQPVILDFDDEFEFIAKDRGTIALDGEREVEFSKDQRFIFKVRRTGPLHVDVVKALESAQENGFFTL